MALDLGKQVGPLPLGAWVVVVGGGLGYAMYARGHSAPTATDAGTTNDNPLTGDNAVGTGVDGLYTDTSPTGAPAPAVGPPTDNDAWGRLAINGLIADGYDPALSQAAITNALQGNNMSTQQYALWRTALMKFGAPPNAIDVAPPVVGIPGPVTTPKPSTGTPAPSHTKRRKGGRWFAVTGGKATLAQISTWTYGSAAYVDAIYQANRKGVRRPDGSHGWLKNKTDSLNQQVPGRATGRRLWLPAENV